MYLFIWEKGNFWIGILFEPQYNIIRGAIDVKLI